MTAIRLPSRVPLLGFSEGPARPDHPERIPWGNERTGAACLCSALAVGNAHRPGGADLRFTFHMEGSAAKADSDSAAVDMQDFFTLWNAEYKSKGSALVYNTVHLVPQQNEGLEVRS